MVIVVLLLFVIVLITFFIGNQTSSDEYLCLNCKHKGVAQKVRKGNTLLEIILWLIFLIPGMLYTIWRNTSRITVCTLCNSKEIIPICSPRAKEILKSSPYTDQTTMSNLSAKQVKIQEFDEGSKEINKLAYALISVLLALVFIIVIALLVYVIIDYKMKNPI